MPTGIYVRTKPPWNKGREMPIEQRLKISSTLKARGIKPKAPFRFTGKKRPPFSEKWLQNLSDSHKGKKPSEETRRKMSKAKKGSKSHLWKGGITPVNKQLRHSLEYKLWRTEVFKKDDYTCVWCGARNGNGKTVILHADHIKPFAKYPEFRFAVDNGRTLCENCHKLTETYKKR